MIERPDIDALMAGDLGRFLEAQVQVREEAKATTRSRFLISALVLLPVIAFLLVTPLGEFKIWLIFGALIGAGVWSYAPSARAKKDTKSGINSAIASALGLTYSHDCEAGRGFERAEHHKMFPGYSRKSFEDEWCGEIGDLPFSMREVHLEQRRSSGKNSHYVTVFRGPVITIGCTREFHGTTLLERSGRHRKFGFFGEKDELKVGDKVLQKADMVNPDFEDAFTVFTTDQVEARYLVHPSYIEKLVALEQAFNGNNIRALFDQSEITIVLKTDDMFESGSLDHSRDREMVEMCVRQFMAMAALATAFNEDRR